MANGATNASTSPGSAGRRRQHPERAFGAATSKGSSAGAVSCEIVAAKPYELVWRTVPTALYPDSTEWTIRLHGAGSATRIEQSFTVLRGPKVLAVLYGLLLPAHRDRTAALTEDLHRLGDLARRSPHGANPEVSGLDSRS